MRPLLRACVAVLLCLVASLAGAARRVLDLNSAPLAAVLPQSLTVEVAGSPALASTVSGAIMDAIQTKLAKTPGATVTFAMPSVDSLRTGASANFTVRTRVKAPDTLEALGDVTVAVHNVPLPAAKDELLWYCNNPESVQRPGALFSSTLKLGSPARLLYHHTNAAEQAMFLRVQAINDTDTPARLLIIPGDSAPDRDPVHAGLRAADQYVRAELFGSGEVVTIPPRQTLPLSVRRLLPGEAMSGLCSLRLLSGPPALQVRTDAWALFPIDKSWESALWSSTPWREVGTTAVNDYDRAPYEPSVQIFSDPYRQDSLDYRVGDRFGVWRIGQKPIASLDDQQKLDGNFGVLYSIHTTISNPTSVATDVELVFEASAGYAGGIFVIDGSVLDVSPTKPKAQVRLARYHLDPGAHRAVSVITLPLSGSSYPASLMIRPVQSSVSGRN